MTTLTHEMLEDSTPDTQERFVDELADGEDCWLSIVDAARYTRRQEDTIRRWIACGLLPIRRVQASSNQHPRQIRMSDLEEMVPLVDKTLVITGDQKSPNSTNIPAEQAQIQEAQQHILNQLDHLQQEFEEQARKHTLSLTEQVRQHQQALYQFREIVEQWQNERCVHLSPLPEDQTQKLFQALKAIEQFLEEQAQRLDEQERQAAQLQETLSLQQEYANQWREDAIRQRQEAAELKARQEPLEQRVEQLEELFHSLSTQLVWQGELVQQQYQKLTDNLATWSEQIESWQQGINTRLEQFQPDILPTTQTQEDCEDSTDCPSPLEVVVEKPEQ